MTDFAKEARDARRTLPSSVTPIEEADQALEAFARRMHAAGVAEGLATAAAICEAHAAKIAAAAPKSPFILAHRLDVEAILAASPPAREPE